MIITKYEKNNMSKEKVTLQCMSIANGARFPTNYDDVYDHLFGNEELLKLFIKDNNGDIKGFGIFDTIEDYYKIMYIAGIILGHDIQGKGYSKDLISKAYGIINSELITARTHNPRVLNSLISAIPCSDYYPNNRKVPYQIFRLLREIPYFKGINEDLIIKNCYPDEKPQQQCNKSLIYDSFHNLESLDAYGIIGISTDCDAKKVKQLKQ